MVSNTSNITFYLPIMALIVVELTRVAREINLHKVVLQEHRPLLISFVFLIPFYIFKALIWWGIMTLRSEIRWMYRFMNSPVVWLRRGISIQVRMFEILSRQSSENDRNSLQKESENVFEYYEKRVDFAFRKVVTIMAQYEANVLNSLSGLESFFAPPLGRFALLHSTNYVILGYLSILSYSSLSGQIRTISMAIISILWLMLPVLEVEEYDHLLKADKPALSFGIHFSLTAFNILISFNLFPLELPVGNEFLVIALGALAIWSFLHLLYNEVNKYSSTGRIYIGS